MIKYSFQNGNSMIASNNAKTYHEIFSHIIGDYSPFNSILVLNDGFIPKES